MDVQAGLLWTSLGCILLCPLVSRSARRRGVRKATVVNCFQTMIVGLCLGELIWLPFSVQLAPAASTHPLSFVYMDHALAQLPLMGIMGCSAVVGTIYWGCTAVVLGLLSFKRWSIPLTKATRAFLPWISLWTLAHMFVLMDFAQGLVEGNP